MFVKPGPDPEKPGSLLKVRDPRTMQLLPDSGVEVPENDFFLRRLRDGDVVLATASEPSDAPSASEAGADGESK